MFHHILFLLVQLPDKSQRLFPENRHPHFCQCHILQGHTVLAEIDVIHPECSPLHVDGSAQRQIVLPAQILGLVVGAILVQPGKVDVLAALPQLFGTVCPLVAGKADDWDGAQCCFSRKQSTVESFCDLGSIFSIEHKIAASFKSNQSIRVLRL